MLPLSSVSGAVAKQVLGGPVCGAQLALAQVARAEPPQLASVQPSVSLLEFKIWSCELRAVANTFGNPASEMLMPLAISSAVKLKAMTSSKPRRENERRAARS
jgi:hypothetical protein